MISTMRGLLIVVLMLTFCSASDVRAQESWQNARRIETRYYILQTDIDAEDAKEAALRITRLAEEYHQRTRGFAGTIKRKLPFAIFRSESDYYAAGGLDGTIGMFDGHKLLAIAGQRANAETWSVVQHEGFHQFAHEVIGGELPIWLNEGMAEYFGEAVFTGDNYISGVVPNWRLELLREAIKRKTLVPIPLIMNLTHAQWNGQLSEMNYLQAWAMVHFLVHAENGKYRDALGRYVQAVSRNRGSQRAWEEQFGKDINAFEQRFYQYWAKLPDNPTASTYARAATRIFTNFLARAAKQKKFYGKLEAISDDLQSKELKLPGDDWLPPSLLRNTLTEVKKAGAWTVEANTAASGRVVGTLSSGLRAVGKYTIKSGKIDVDVELDDTAVVLSTVESVLDTGDRQKARKMLNNAIKNNPDSPDAQRARKTLQEMNAR